MGEVLVTNQLQDKLVGALTDRLQVTREDRVPLSSKHHAGQWINIFFWNLASGVKPVPGFYRLTFMGIDWDRTVHLLYYFFSVLVSLYSTARRIFACVEDLTANGFYLFLFVRLP